MKVEDLRGGLTCPGERDWGTYLSWHGRETCCMGVKGLGAPSVLWKGTGGTYLSWGGEGTCCMGVQRLGVPPILGKGSGGPACPGVGVRLCPLCQVALKARR
jgi:hypothetical protein